MGFDPISWSFAATAGTVAATASVPASTLALTAAAATAAGVAAHELASGGKGSGVPSMGNADSTESAAKEIKSKKRQYRPAAQVFRNEDLRLGAHGKLGL